MQTLACTKEEMREWSGQETASRESRSIEAQMPPGARKGGNVKEMASFLNGGSHYLKKNVLAENGTSPGDVERITPCGLEPKTYGS